MKKLITIIFLLLFVNAFSQNTYRVEYFIDNDNGFGQNKLENIVAGNDIIFNKTISLNGLTDGLHTLFVRVKDDKNNWSSTNNYSFIKLTENKVIKYTEYFIDGDPGYGKATNLEARGDLVNLSETIDLNNISDGMHSISIRSKDEDNNWSTTTISCFICEDMDKYKINDVEYFIDDDPGLGEATKIHFTKSSKLILNLNIDLNSYNEGMHTISFRSRNNLGIWSKNYVFNFEIKEGLAITDIDKINLLAYPSPTTGNFTIELENILDNIEVVTTDLTGKVISDRHYKRSSKITENIIGNNGIYVVYVFSENKKIRIFKILKK